MKIYYQPSHKKTHHHICKKIVSLIIFLVILLPASFAQGLKESSSKEIVQKEKPHSAFALSRWWGTSNFGALSEEWDPFQGVVAGYLWKDGNGKDAKVYVDVNMRQWPDQHGACTFRITGDKLETLRDHAKLPKTSGTMNTSDVIVWLEGKVSFEKEVGWPALENVDGLGERGGILYSMNCKKVVTLKTVNDPKSEDGLDDLHHKIREKRKIKIKVKGFIWKHPKSGTLCLDTYSMGMYSFTYRLKGKMADELLKKAPSMDPDDNSFGGDGGENATHGSTMFAEIEGLAELKESLERFQGKQALKKSGGYLYDLEISKIHKVVDSSNSQEGQKPTIMFSSGKYMSYGMKFPYKANQIKTFDNFKDVTPTSGKIKELGSTKSNPESIHQNKGELKNKVQRALIVAYKTVQEKFIKEDNIFLQRIYLLPHLTRPNLRGTVIENGGIDTKTWQKWSSIKDISKRPYWMIKFGLRGENYLVFVDAETSSVVYAAFYHSKTKK